MADERYEKTTASVTVLIANDARMVADPPIENVLARVQITAQDYRTDALLWFTRDSGYRLIEEIDRALAMLPPIETNASEEEAIAPGPAETMPWESPQVGDTLRDADEGFSRRVIEVDPIGASITYQNQNGVRAFCLISSWISWADRTVRAGGSYRRASEEGT